MKRGEQVITMSYINSNQIIFLRLASNVSALIIIKNYMFLKGELFSKAQQCVLVSALLIKTKSCLSLHNCTLSKS